VHAQNTRAGSNRTYHLVISLHPEDRSLDNKELRHVVENLVDKLGFSEHQYVAARHNDKDHEHVHVAINKIHPETSVSVGDPKNRSHKGADLASNGGSATFGARWRTRKSPSTRFCRSRSWPG